MNVIKRQIRRPVVSRMTIQRMNEHQPEPSENKKPEEPKVKLTVKKSNKVKEDVVETKQEEVVETQEVVVEQEAAEEEKPAKKTRRTKKTEKTTETENEDNKEN